MVIPEGYKKTEVGIIPEDWDIIDFEQVGVYFKGKGISMRDVKLYGKPCIMYGDIYVKFDTHFYDCDYYVDDITASKSIRALPQDLFFTASGETAEDIGRCVSYLGKAAIFIGGDIIALRPHNQYDSLFLSYVQNSHSLKRQKAALAQGNSVVHISTSNIQKTIFACPRKKQEQINISSVLYDVDNTIDNLEKLVEKKKNIKQGAMQELLTGKRRLPGFDGEWEIVRFGDLSNVYRGGSPRPIQEYLTNSLQGINWIKIGDTRKEDKYIISTVERIIPEGVSMSREVFAGDLLLSNSMSFGRPYILRINGCIHDGWLVIQDYQESFNQQYLYYSLLADYVKNQFTKMAAGSGVHNLNKDIVSNVVLHKPEIDEQEAIASILSDMDNEIEELEKKLAKYRNIKQGMMSELLSGHIRLTEKEGA